MKFRIMRGGFPAMNYLMVEDGGRLREPTEEEYSTYHKREVRRLIVGFSIFAIIIIIFGLIYG